MLIYFSERMKQIIIVITVVKLSVNRFIYTHEFGGRWNQVHIFRRTTLISDGRDNN